MVRKSLLALLLVLPALGAGRPAGADPKFLEAYPDIFGARTLLGSPTDARPKDAIQNQETGEGNGRNSAFILGGFGRFSSGPGPYTAAGGGIGYSHAGGAHPFEVKVAGYDFNPHSVGGFDLPGRLGIDGTAKFILWQSPNAGLPVVSAVGRYRNINNIFHRWDAALAVDQKVFSKMYITGNLGYGSIDTVGFGGDHSAFVSGVGATYEISPKLSIAANYVPENAVENRDFWSAALTYAVNRDLAISGGGGKDDTFFGQFTYKFGKRGGTAAAAQK